MWITPHLKRPTRISTWARLVILQSQRFLFGLAPRRVYRAIAVTSNAVRSYRTISPLPHCYQRGGIFSVALSVSSRFPDVIWFLSPMSPDFPPEKVSSLDKRHNQYQIQKTFLTKRLSKRLCLLSRLDTFPSDYLADSSKRAYQT